MKGCLFILILFFGINTSTRLHANLTHGLLIPLGQNWLYLPERKGHCTDLSIYFPGHAQELSLLGTVTGVKRRSWVKELLWGAHYHLLPSVEKRGCPVLFLGDSETSLSSEEALQALQKSDLSGLKLLVHSGGYKGFGASLEHWDSTILRQIHALSLLDCFYSEKLSTVLREKLGEKKLKSICDGFYTEHNEERYQKHFSQLCLPSRVKKRSPPEAHKSAVKLYF